MNVNLIIGAHAYACITHDNGRTDIRLEHGKGAPASLRAYALDKRKQAQDAIYMADLAERAANVLDGKA